MGIHGLASYVKRYCLEDYELGQTDLVIDGNNLAYDLYINHAKCNDLYGGDYDKYAQAVSDFFDDLFYVDVRPIVILHGSYKESKVPTVLSRMSSKISKLTHRSSQARLMPLFLVNVFVNILKKKNILCGRCIFEADETIAAMAKELNCPVLSNASDFYVYNVLTIASVTLLSSMLASRKAAVNHCSKTIYCKVYRLELLLNSFEGLNQHTLSLASIVTCNDTLRIRTAFANFHAMLKLECHEVKLTTLEATLRWLSKYTLEDAITAILETTPVPARQYVLNIMEENVNRYTNPSGERFPHLSIPLGSSTTKELYKYKGDIVTLPYKKYSKRSNNIQISYHMKLTDALLEWKQYSNDRMFDRLPGWLKLELSMALHMSFIVEIIEHYFYVTPIQFEQLDSPTSTMVGFDILRTIFGLLNSIVPDVRKRDFINLVIRNQEMNIVCTKLTEIITVPLSTVRELSSPARKEIINNVLGITGMQFIEKVLPEWQLYIACIKYWINHTPQYDLPMRHKYIYSILICMLYKKTVSKIGYYSSLDAFAQSKQDIIQSLTEERQSSNVKQDDTDNITLAEACNEIDTLDCLLAAPFFITHSQYQPMVHPDDDDLSIQHAFAEFQWSLYNIISLNGILGFPYDEPHMADFYNGTLLYNLCTIYNNRTDIHTYKNIIFNKSPSLLRAYNVLLSTVKPLFI